ncbi:polymorphic toxin-type HINT domain-containing protein [Nonomuraea angiospora]|uniref:polymorphic toxin-type HINT domain-containing protein n=1 Tax=Nonomuraea angiospora TaxID=46172 RepID=UPI0033308414
MTPKQQMGSGDTFFREASAPAAVAAGAKTQADRPVPGALPGDKGAWPRTALQPDPDPDEVGLPGGVRRAEQADRLAAGPLIDDVYPEWGSLVGSVTPLLTVRATKLGGGTSADLRFTFNVCEKPEETDVIIFPPPPAPPCWDSGVKLGEETWRVPAGTMEWGKQYEWWVRIDDPDSGGVATSSKQLIATGARQPVNSAHLGDRAGNGQEFTPVTGNYTTTVVDARVQVAGPALSVVRTYNSMDLRPSGIFGAGWSSLWDMNVAAERSGTTITGLLVTYASGRRVRFAPKGDGTYQPPPGTSDALADVTGGGWRLKDTASTTYVFNAAGRLLKLEDSRGRAQTLAYNADGTFATVTSPGGRALHFTWNGSRVATVSTDPVDGSARTWTYTYTGDNLTSVCSPAAAPNCTTYSYGDGSRYKGLVLDSEPLGYWRLGDAQYEPAGNLGSEGGAGIYKDVTIGQPGALEGSADTAAGFTKSTMMLPWNMLDRARDQVTVEGWIKTAQNGVIFSAGQFGYEFGATQPVLYVGTDGKLRGQLGQVSGIGYAPITSAGPVNDNQWHHVALTVAGDKQKLYLDGQVVGQLNGQLVDDYRYYAYVGSGDRGSSWSDIPGGQSASGAFAFKGTIDEFALYGKPLSDADVQAHWAARAKVNNKLAQITLPSGRIWAKNTYHAATDRLLTHTDRHGGTWQLGEPDIDWVERLDTIKVTDPRGGAINYAYDGLRQARLVSVSDQASGKTSFEYDTGGFVKKQTDPNGNVFEWWNDKRGNPIQGKSCRKADDCKYAYADYHVNEDDDFDARNDQMLVYRDARSSGPTSNTYATTWQYNTYGELTKEMTPATPDFPNGRSASVAYTDGTETAIGGGTTPAGLIASRTDARNNAWTYRYTSAGDLAEQRDPEGRLVKLSYDALGQLRETSEISQAYPDGVKTVLTYDALGRPASRTQPGVRNEISGVTHTQRTANGYDADGNVLSETISDLTGGDAERVTAYTYDAHGRVETVTGPEGGVVRQSWNSIGSLASVTDARGAVVDYGYNERGQLTSKTLKGWTGSPVNPQPATNEVLESFDYDAGGRLITRIDAMKRTTTFEYYNDNLPAKKIASAVKLNGVNSPRNVTLEEYTYDAAGNQIKLVAGGGKVTTESVYDAAGRLTSRTFDPAKLGRKTAFVYDANGNTLKTTRTAAGTSRAEGTEYAYNKADQVTTTTVDNGSTDLVSTVTYDDRGLAVAATDPRGNADGADKNAFTSQMRYDALGRLVEATGPQVTVEEAGTAGDARPSIRYGYDTTGAKTHERDAEGRTLTSVYDKAGRLTRQSAPSYTPPGGTALTPTTVHAYDAAGQLISTTDPRGNITTFDYDKLGRQVRVTDPAPAGQAAGTWVSEYDLAGEQRAMVDPTGSRREATYDDLGRQITATQIERKPATAIYVSKMEYDDAGRLVKQIPHGSVNGSKDTVFTVNAAGEVETVTDPLNNTTRMEYDLAGRLVKTTDPNGNASTAEYDLAGRKTTVKDLTGASSGAGTVLRTYGQGYDLAGNPTSATSPEGHVTRQTFDALNRVTSLIEPVSASESITTRFGYDAAGARTRLTDGRGNATWTTYNSLGLVEMVTEPATTAHPSADDRTWTHLYDQAGNATATLQPGGVRIDRTFDHLGRLTTETGQGGGAATAARTLDYDLAGRLTTAGDLSIDYNDRNLPLKIQRGSTQETAYGYDALGNPTQRVDAAGTAAFTWDNASRLATATDPVTGRTLTYGYDPASRLKTITATSGTASTQSFDYDDLDRVTGQTLKNGSGTQLAKITYGWDKDDNLTTKTTAGTAGAGTNTYGYDHAGRLTSWTAPGGAVTAYEWDAAGNRTKAGDKTFTYDERNRLTSGDGTDYTYTPRGTLATSTKAGATTSYTFDAFDRLIADGDSLYSYDALDRLASRITGAAKDVFAYSGLGNDLAAMRDSGGAVQATYARDPGGGLLGLKEGTGAPVAALSDLHDDLIATYTTTLQTSTAYDPFGTVTTQTGTKTNLGYQGEYTDPDTGKVNMHARWYQPGTGTFTSRDTATLNPSPSVQANRYTYANASPLTGTDPTGHYTAIGGGSVAGPSAYTPGVDYQTAADIYAQHGIMMGGGSSGGGGTCIGSCYGGGGVVDDACVSRGFCLDSGAIEVDPAAFAGDVDPFGKLRLIPGLGRIIGCLQQGGCSGSKTNRRTNGYSNANISKIQEAKGESFELACVSMFGSAGCGAVKDAAAKAALTKKYLNECLGPNSGIERCMNWQRELGISDDQLEELNRQWWERWDKQKGGSLWDDPVFDFFFGDAKDCANGSITGCALFALNFLPGVGVAAKSGVKGLTKLVGVLGKSGSVIAKACSSFVPGTLVVMADGSRRPIEEIRVGDEVLATDPATGETAAKKVSALINSSGTKNLIKITIKAGDKGNAGPQAVIATAQHPFWVPSRQEWVDATYLQSDAWLRTPAGSWIQITDVKRWTAPQQVYNLTVADLHTYYVVAGNASVLVHNANCYKMLSAIGSDPGLVRAAEAAGRSHQRSLDKLTAELMKGNLNPGIGNGSLKGTGIMYARARDGARVFFIQKGNTITIVGKANKGNEDSVIKRLQELYG